MTAGSMIPWLLWACAPSDEPIEPSTTSEPWVILSERQAEPVGGPLVHAGGVWVVRQAQLVRIDVDNTPPVPIRGLLFPTVVEVQSAGPDRLLVVARSPEFELVTHLVDTSSNPAVVLWDTGWNEWGLPFGRVGDRVPFYADGEGGGFLDVVTGEFTLLDRWFFKCFTGPAGACCPVGEVPEVVLMTELGVEIRSTSLYGHLEAACWLHDDGAVTMVGTAGDGEPTSTLHVVREHAVGDPIWAQRLDGVTPQDWFTDPASTSGDEAQMLSTGLGEELALTLRSDPAGLTRLPGERRVVAGDGYEADLDRGGVVHLVSPTGNHTELPVRGNLLPRVLVHEGRTYAVFGNHEIGGGASPWAVLLTFGLAAFSSSSTSSIEFEIARSSVALEAGPSAQ